MADILIKNAFIATMDKKRTIYRQGSLYIENDRIVEIGSKVKIPGNPEYEINAENKVIMPGFVNTHCHLQQYSRGFYELFGDFYKVDLPLEECRRSSDMEQLGFASCAEFIYGGCTTAQIIYTYPEGFARAVEQAGNRVILAADIEEVDLKKLSSGVYRYLPEKGEAAFRRATELYKNWHGKADGRITTVMAPKAPDLATAETYLKCKRFAERHGLRMTTHLSQTWREVEQVEKLYNKTPPQHLHALNILSSQLTGAHCTYATEKDIQLIAASRMGILHCRSVTNPLIRWIDMGIPVSLGTDNYHHDMLQLLRQNIAGQKTRARLVGGAEGMLSSSNKTARPTFYELLELATRGGAEVLGIDKEVGSLEPGKKADIIIFNMDNPYLTPSMDPLTSIVLYGSSADIDTVIVDGNILKNNGVLTTIDMKQALKTAQGKVEEIIDRFSQEHADQKEIWQQKTPYMR